MPHPTVSPACFRLIIKSASTKNEVTIPAVVVITLLRIVPTSLPDCFTKPSNFNEITGNTHGMKFKMNPPIKP